MNTQTNKRLLILPFITGRNGNAALDIEHLIIQGIEYKLFPVNNIKIIDVKQKQIDTPIKPIDNTYSLSAIRLLADRYSAHYAIVGRFDTDESGFASKVFIDLYNIINFEVIANWESAADCFTYMTEVDYTINVTLFNQFLSLNANNIIENINIEIDYVIKQYLDEPLFKDIEAYKALVHFKKQASTHSEKLGYLNSASKLEPELEFPYMEMGKIMKNKRNYEEATKYYQLAIENSSSDALISYYLSEIGSCCALKENYSEAITYWEKAINHYPSYINPYMNIALAYEEQDNLEKAEECFLEIQQLSPSDPRTYFSLARIYSKKDNWMGAIEQYNTMIKFQPNDAWSHSNIANCYLQLGKNKDAKGFFYKAMELDPDGEAGNYASQVVKALEEASKKDWWKFWQR